jgi:hypothetical protein
VLDQSNAELSDGKLEKGQAIATRHISYFRKSILTDGKWTASVGKPIDLRAQDKG